MTQINNEEISPKVCGWQIAVKLHLKPEKIGSIVIPDSIRDNEKYRACSGTVVGVGPDAYRSSRFEGEPWCKVGDLVAIPRHEGIQIEFKGHPIHILNDSSVLMKLDNLDDVMRA